MVRFYQAPAARTTRPEKHEAALTARPAKATFRRMRGSGAEGEEGSAASAATARPSRLRRVARDGLSLVAFLAIALTARASLADHYVVPTGSMIPTVKEGDRVIVSKAAYGLRVPLSHAWVARWSEPKRGDVVVLESPGEGIILLKRVVALPGDLVEVQAGHLILNGERVKATDREETLDGKSHPLSLDAGGGPDFGPKKVPPNSVLVMGDNRGNSRDGRMFGFVDLDTVLGRAVAVYSRQGDLVWNEL